MPWLLASTALHGDTLAARIPRGVMGAALADTTLRWFGVPAALAVHLGNRRTIH